ncbi:fumarylacetoacetate hydrolase family protein [Pseudonocardia sp. NPDC049635]|uniref:fumarylacetoacetate hydrolase family protein n=1 Tax=Pseudonocardia sp. NPDC049635 TaxID=3155506 RepID=UPI00340FC329
MDVEKASAGMFPADLQAVLERWEEFTEAAPGFSLDDATPNVPASALDAPVGRPRQIVAIGLNYSEHAAEGGFEVPTELPTVFTKFASSITGPEGQVVLPGKAVDWEVELVVTVGRTARNVPAVDAWSHVAGLSVGQDLSERDDQFVGNPAQFSLGKSHAGFAPIGPHLVTLDEVPDPDDLRLTCTLNGTVVQDARTREMVYDVPVLFERLSKILTLYPGDLIFTGTPAGVGLGRTPPEYLKAGDVLESWIEGVGTLRQELVAP